MKYLIWLLIPCLLFAEDKANYKWNTGNTGDVIITDDDNVRMELDPLGYLVTVDIEHHKIHEGESYAAAVYDSDLDSDTLFVFINTPATGEIHFLASITASNTGIASFYETPDVTDSTNMTTVTCYNNNRQSSNTTSATVYYWLDGSTDLDIAAANLGTLLESARIGSSLNPAKATGGVGEQREEWILKQSGQYLIIFVADNDNTDVRLQVSYYEVDL